MTPEEQKEKTRSADRLRKNTDEVRRRRRAQYANNPGPQKEANRLRRIMAPEEQKEKIRADDRFRKNTEEIRRRRRVQYAENPGPRKEASRLGRVKGRMLDLAAVREKERQRRAIQRKIPLSHLRDNLRSRLSGALKRAAKHGRTFELLGMAIKEYRIYLQGQFLPGMNWENQGSVWHIDHIKPCASFDLTTPAQQRECFNWSNTQPMFAAENIRKGARLAHV